ncbi:MAG: helix-turn-helix domain-containing protein [Bacteroidetes bacterium]|nr:helix-turn-helix domain-containing protein [Bacteroidota bacterium]
MHQPPENQKEREYFTRLRTVLAFIQENLSEDMSLEKLKIFLRYVGETPKQYIIRLRLERIAHYLKLYPELSINEASVQSGFSSPSAFIRAFKKYFGVTPEAFRRISMDEISKKGTFKPNIGRFHEEDPSDLWSMNLTEEELTDLNASMNIGVTTFQGLRVIFMDSHLGEPDAIPKTFATLTRWAEPRGLLTEDTQFVDILLDMPFFTELGKCRFRACISVAEGVELPKGMGTTLIPGGRCASFSVKGSLQGGFKKLLAFGHGWITQSGYQIAEITGFQVYSVNPATKPYETIQRQIFIPVRPA